MTGAVAALVAGLPRPAQELVDNPSFRYGLKGGLIAAVILALPGLLTGRLFRPERGPAIGWAGLAPAVVTIVALHRLDDFARPADGVSGFEWGVVGLVVGGIVAALVPWRWAGVLWAAPGAYLICWPGLEGALQTNRVLGFVAIVLLAPLLAEFDRQVSVPGLAVLLAAGSCAGIYATVPDTEKAALLLAVAIPVGLVGWPLGLAHLGRAGSFACVGAAVWAVEAGGAARPGSIVGGLGTFALVALAPLLWWWLRDRPPAARGLGARTAGWSPWALGLVAVAGHALVVLWASRVAGLEEGRPEALALLAPAALLALVIVAALPALGPAGAATAERRTGRAPDHAALGPAGGARGRSRDPLPAPVAHAALGPAVRAGRPDSTRTPAGVGADHPALGPAVSRRRTAAYAVRDLHGGPRHDAAPGALADPLTGLLSPPSRRLVMAITVLWGLGAVPGLAVLTHGHLRVGALVEAVSYLGLALGVASITAVRSTFSRLARVPAAILVLGAVLITFGQLGGGGRHLFPLVRFNVYTDATGAGASDFTSLEGQTRDGRRVLVTGDEVFHSLENGRFVSFEGRLLRASGLESGRATDGSHDGAVDDYRRFLLGVLQQYNEEHTPHPLVSLDVVAYDLPDVPAVADDRDDVRSQLLITVRADGSFEIPAGAAATADPEQGDGRVIHERFDRSTLALLRVWIFGIWFVGLLLDPIQQLAALPDDLFQPPGFLKVVPLGTWERLLEERTLLAFRVGLLVVLFLVAIGAFRRPYVPMLAAAGVAVYQGIVRGYSGHMNHAEIMLLWATMLIVFFPMSEALSIRRPRVAPVDGPDLDAQARGGVLALAILFAASYFFVAAVRITKGVDLFTTDSLRNNLAGHWAESGHLVDGTYRLPGGTPFWDAVPSPVMKLLFAGVTLLELAVPLVLISKWARRLIVPGLLLFHVMNIVLLGIPFIEDMLMLVLFSSVAVPAIGRRLADAEVRVRTGGPARTSDAGPLTTQRA